MMKKNYLLAVALALTAMVSCTDESFVGDQSLKEAGEGAISFNLNTPAVTRANKEGAAAATDLGNYFLIYGEKGETSKAKYSAGNLVFPNYTVQYGANTAYTTTSNTKNWEYVGVTPISTTNVKMYDGSATTPVTSDAQTIKYWDYGATSYTFTAVSADKGDIENGRVVIQKNTVSDESVYQKGYTITLAKSGSDPYTYPTVNKLFLADRKVIEHSTGTNREATNAYGGNVTMQFRNFVSHIRAGVYETIPGYDITAISFYIDNGSGQQTTLAQVSSVNAFGAKCPNISTTNYEGTLTVTYYESGAVENQPKVTATGTPATNLILGTNMSTISDASDNQLGKTATTPTWDKAAGAYTEVMPQIENSTNLKLKCNYTLWNSVTKETITVESATAEIPAEYLQWKPNFKYTYIFKISDNTNGYTGGSTDPAGLYPITFDAIEVVAEDGQAEYITSVSEPSITTIGVKDSKYSVGNTDYDPSTDVYATVMDASSLATLSASNFSIYDVFSSDDTNFPVTEASVAEALIEGPTWTADQASNKKITCANGPALTFQNTVPAEDGTTKTLDASLNKAAKFTTGTGKKYALVYQKTAATYYASTGATYASSDAFTTAKSAALNDKLYTDEACTSEASSWADATTTYYQINGKKYTSEQFAAAGKLYEDAACTTVASSWTENTIYYKPTRVNNKGVYAIKIVTVE